MNDGNLTKIYRKAENNEITLLHKMPRSNSAVEGQTLYTQFADV